MQLKSSTAMFFVIAAAFASLQILAADALTADECLKLIAQLDHDDFQIRQAAELKLKAGGAISSAAVSAALKKQGLSIEATERLRRIWNYVDGRADWDRLVNGGRYSFQVTGASWEKVALDFEQTYGFPLQPRLNERSNDIVTFKCEQATWQGALQALAKQERLKISRSEDALQLWQDQNSQLILVQGILINIDVHTQDDGASGLSFEVCIPSRFFERSALRIASARLSGGNGTDQSLADSLNSISTHMIVPKVQLEAAGSGAKVEFDVRLKWPGILKRKTWDLPLRAPIDLALSDTRRVRLAFEEKAEKLMKFEVVRTYPPQEFPKELFGHWDFFDGHNQTYSPPISGGSSGSAFNPDRVDEKYGIVVSSDEIKIGRVEYVYSDDITEHKLKYVVELSQPQKK